MPHDSFQDHVVAQWVDHTLGRKAAITDVGAALQQVGGVNAAIERF